MNISMFENSDSLVLYEDCLYRKHLNEYCNILYLDLTAGCIFLQVLRAMFVKKYLMLLCII